MKNPYTVLGVAKTASTAEIKAAFRRLVKETHPDLNNNNPVLIPRFHEITEAYAILSDPMRKAAYDAYEHESLKKNNENTHHQNTYECEDTKASKESSYQTEYWYYDAKIKAAVIETLIRQLHEQVAPAKAQAGVAIFKGLAWAIGGILLTFFTYNMAVSAGGGRYSIFWGAILFGSIQAIRAFSLYSKINNAVAKAEQELWDSL